jgi:hypothetical protein
MPYPMLNQYPLTGNVAKPPMPWEQSQTMTGQDLLSQYLSMKNFGTPASQMSMDIPMPDATATYDGPGFMDRMKGAIDNSGVLPGYDPNTGKQNSMGWGMPLFGVLSGLNSAYMGMKQYGLAKDALQNAKDEFGINYNTQKQILNTRMEDIQRAKRAASPNAESVDSYMARNRIK